MKFYILIFVLGILILYGLYYRKNPLIAKVRIGTHIFSVDVAVTPLEKMKGLGGKDRLDSNHGMLFVYDHKEKYEFWMKGMKFPLDFIWIKDNTVVDLRENIPAPLGLVPAIVKPNTEADKILEINAGIIRSTGITIGDSVQFLDR